MTKTHLTLIRAALQFFDEEMSLHGVRVMRPYFDEPLVTEFAEGEIRQLRERLQNCKLAYIRCNASTMTLASTEPSLNLEDVGPTPASQSAEIATVLFLPPS